jgi:hypothetical protein
MPGSIVEQRKAGRMLRRVIVVAAVVAALAAVASAFGGGQPDLEQARQATAAFHDLDAAKHAGYDLLTDAAGIACIDMPGVGAMGVHYANGDLAGTPTVELTKPEALVYAPTAAGGLRLVALEYVVFKGAWDADHASPPSLFGQEFNVTPFPNRFGLPAFYSLHAWVWKPNPAGTFAMFNPNVSCPSGAGGADDMSGMDMGG